MSTNQNIGKWSASIEKKGNDRKINVNGSFPTNGEKPMYRLIKNESQGSNDTELILTLEYGTLATLEGKVFFPVSYSEVVAKKEKYKTVLVVDENVRTIANIKVTVIEDSKRERRGDPPVDVRG